MRKILISCIVLLISFSSFAGSIRTVTVDAKKMQTIYLKMGQSTVLRFREKPKKVIVGNSNYYNIEFIDNDLTIQPKGAVSSNLFVYGEYHTFGFNLAVNSPRRFDDLVNVRWKTRKSFKKRTKKKVSRSKSVNKKFTLSKNLVFHIQSVQQDRESNTTIVDLEAQNISKEKVDTNKINVLLTRSRKALLNQEYIFIKDNILPQGKVRLRVIVKPVQNKGFSMETSYLDKKNKAIISRKFL